MHRLAREARLMGNQCDLGSLGTEFVNLVIAINSLLMVCIIPFRFAVRAPFIPGREGLWTGKLPDAAQAGTAMQLEKPLKGGSPPNHQKLGRALLLYAVGEFKLANVGYPN